MKRLKLVFGIQTFSPSLRVEKDFAAVCQAAKTLIEKQVDRPMTFKVETKRSDHDFAMGTFEMNRELGGYLLQEFPELLTVDVHQPDIEVRVEVRLNGIFLTSEIIKGAGGLPVGTAGKGMMMLSGGLIRQWQLT